MTVIALHEHSDVGRLALRTANAEAELRNTQLIVLFALSHHHPGGRYVARERGLPK
ncbi:hypothetical protein OPAG_06550 [Rhodococcus opacus PD630]|uniref:hypothetical protein n=1 Tax=Rhodococcus opacus TaxID=37919 RepID=UPI00029CB278|nr:hypothetical protein [Rhodococcus opacus]AHK27551.1 hypothetical protein Pd630_LPD00307 [Rhodococcus opacus PD630]EHI42214.1 hypothetical protein OPAG_06550 [Rhodococcus opacus PD630]UDG97531.1 hypothetical protein K2Z90_000291 [Rhodococcus opacus PD630]